MLVGGWGGGCSYSSALFIAFKSNVIMQIKFFFSSDELMNKPEKEARLETEMGRGGWE